MEQASSAGDVTVVCGMSSSGLPVLECTQEAKIDGDDVDNHDDDPRRWSSAKELQAAYRARQRVLRPEMFSDKRMVDLGKHTQEGINMFAGARAARASEPLHTTLRMEDGDASKANADHSRGAVLRSESQHSLSMTMTSTPGGMPPLRNAAMAAVIARLRKATARMPIHLPGMVLGDSDKEEGRDVEWIDENAAETVNTIMCLATSKQPHSKGCNDDDDDDDNDDLDEQVIDLSQAVESFGGRLLATNPISLPVLFDNFCLGEEDE